jgi:hypothetical protein
MTFARRARPTSTSVAHSSATPMAPAPRTPVRLATRCSRTGGSAFRAVLSPCPATCLASSARNSGPNRRARWSRPSMRRAITPSFSRPATPTSGKPHALAHEVLQPAQSVSTFRFMCLGAVDVRSPVASRSHWATLATRSRSASVSGGESHRASRRGVRCRGRISRLHELLPARKTAPKRYSGLLPVARRCLGAHM